MKIQIRNVYEAEGEIVHQVHGGKGDVAVYRAYSKGDFETRWNFVDFAVIPPGSSIGLHTHYGNEELYFIVSGKGTMIVNDEFFDVCSGDLILNKNGWAHSLVNASSEDIKLFVVEVLV